MDFTHLHVHTDYSIMDGCAMVGELATLAKKYGMRHLVVTDHGNMSAVPAQTTAAKKAGLMPIYGIEFYLNNEGTKPSKSNHLLAIAMNDTGYKNLVKLSSWAWQHGFYYKPRINWKVLKEHSEGIIVTSGCLASEFQQALMSWSEGNLDSMNDLVRLVREYKEVFGDRFYIETQMIGIQEQDTNNPMLIKLADRFGIQCVVTNDVHYASEGDKDIHGTMLKMNTGQEDLFDARQLWFKSAEEMVEFHRQQDYKKFSEQKLIEMMATSYEVACRCEGVEIDTQPKLPEIENVKDKIAQLLYDGMKSHGLLKKSDYRARLVYEMGIISEKGYESYFLIDRDCINHVRSKGYPIGPGRGSAAGSLVCFLLGITEVDPLKHGLIFERFLNPARGGKFARLSAGDPIPGRVPQKLLNPLEHGTTCRCGSCHPLADADLPGIHQIQEDLASIR